MKPVQTHRGRGAFTLVEMLVVVAIIGILAALLLPVLGQAKARAKRVECVNNLKQTGLAFHLFAHDHKGKFTTHVSTNDGGSLEFVAAGYQITRPARFYFSFQHFLPLASELLTPKPLACPADLERWPATNFAQFDNRNLSQAVGLKADPSIPDSILAADRNVPACHAITPNSTLGRVPKSLENILPPYWLPPPVLHDRKGNILFSDGHVDESYDAILLSEEIVVQDLAFPDVKPSPPSRTQSVPTVPANNNRDIPTASYSSNAPVRSSTSTTSRVFAATSPSAPKEPAAPAQVLPGLPSNNTQSHGARQKTPEELFEETPATNPPAERVVSRIAIPPAPVIVSNEPTYVQQLAVAARESLDATQWLLWLLLLLLLLILFARWLDRRWQQRKIKKRFNR